MTFFLRLADSNVYMDTTIWWNARSARVPFLSLEARRALLLRAVKSQDTGQGIFRLVAVARPVFAPPPRPAQKPDSIRHPLIFVINTIQMS
jgi:hypothetical protein